MKCDMNLFKDEHNKFITFISIIHRQYLIYLNNCLKNEEITSSHAPILAYLLYKGTSCQEDIVNHFKIDKGSIARSIQKLQEKQLINKEINENNRRKYQLSLTEKGREVALKIMNLNNEWENQIYSTCNTNEKQIVELMRKMTISSINIQKNTQKEEENG
ncbi:MarR family winged helix-turn-helix transcriptional regulator [uncultured Methanobrevibacter sp.]|uniref:MarR family winged helix-turn-helix transcriptional regulator n=1 Tax=uncultured Methanobrevibacter sp. TaxID=253161 RepID=UPI002618B689|nr:MarR family winged helix-turn-helix transcriptional regulator [uncultured Methanobrevibacter sp.]